jgi:hypothetical protein
MPDNSVQQKTTSLSPWLAGAAGFVIGVAVVGAWDVESRLGESRGALPAPVATSTESSATSSAAVASSGLISVTDQAPGSSATVQAVNVNANVWVAVVEVKGGSLGNVLGARFVTAPATDVVVPLLRPTVPGSTYAVVLYRDNGDRSFSLASDSLYVDFASGDRVVALFSTH